MGLLLLEIKVKWSSLLSKSAKATGKCLPYLQSRFRAFYLPSKEREAQIESHVRNM